MAFGHIEYVRPLPFFNLETSGDSKSAFLHWGDVSSSFVLSDLVFK